MGLMDALDQAASEPVHKGPRCSVGELLEILPGEESERLRQLVDEPLPSGRWLQCSKICVALKANGHEVSVGSLQRHRRRVRGNGDACSCPI